MKTRAQTVLESEDENKTPRFHRNIVALGLVSLFNDLASEMAYPIIPLFLTAVLGAPVAVVGMIEGIAEATASLLKVFSGWLSDRLRNRKRFTVAGYVLSAFSKVVLSWAGSWIHVLAARFMDRFGKGVRTSARDALIAESVGVGNRGSAFGLHRALDTLGAVVGPLLALLWLRYFHGQYARLFFFASFPAFVGVMILILAVREPAHEPRPSKLPLSFSVRQFGKPFQGFLLANLLFALGNSSDAFLILRAQALGHAATKTVLLYVLFNVAYSLLSYPFGKLSDRFGARHILITSFFLFALVYAGFGWVSKSSWLWGLFPLYGFYMAMSEGIGKAYISDLVPANTRATALGFFYTTTGVTTFLSSFIAGLLWQYAGAPAPFYFGAVLSVMAGIVLFSSASRRGGT